MEGTHVTSTQDPAAAPTKPQDIVEAAGMPVGSGNMKPGYDPRLANEDLAPLRKQKWNSYNIFAFWMSDVHSVGGYVTAGSLFALGIAAWQVLVALIVGIVIVQVFTNLVAKPSLTDKSRPSLTDKYCHIGIRGNGGVQIASWWSFPSVRPEPGPQARAY